MVSGHEIKRRLEARKEGVDLQENERSKKTSGIIGWWNRQSTAGKAAIGLIGLCCLGALILIGIGGMLSPENTGSTYTTSDVSTSPEPATDTSTSAAEEQAYIQSMLNYIQDVQSMMEETSTISEGVADGSIDPFYAAEFYRTKKEELDQIISDMEAIDVPSRFQNIHDLILSAFRDYSEAFGLAADGCENLDANSIERATDLIYSGAEKIQQATDELNSIS